MLKAGRSTPFTNRHPWLFSGAIVSETASPQAGEWVRVVDSKGIFIANGLYNPYQYAFDSIHSMNRSYLAKNSGITKLKMPSVTDMTSLAFLQNPILPAASSTARVMVFPV